jgi:Family of unknown function (DUF6090)
MLFWLRRSKHDAFMNEKVRQYLGYAFGEMLLVVVGILLALQINNWNENRKDQATLHSYLQSIARNMREDVGELEPLRDVRVESLYLMSRFEAVRDRERFTVDEIFLFTRLWTLGSEPAFFSANTSGFEALKSSGVLNRLQGSGLEHLLSRYYDVVSQISVIERAINDELRPLATELRQIQPKELEPWAIYNPGALPPDRFEAVQPLFGEMINSPTAAALIDGQYRNRTLVLLYDSLTILGNAFIRAVESGQLDAPDATLRTPMDDFKDRLGTAEIVVAGRPSAESYFLNAASAPERGVFHLDSIQLQDGALHIDHAGGADWAVVYWGPLTDATSTGIAYLDFSRFHKLRLELKGDRGGETIKVHVKDVNYPNDIAPVSVDLVLSDDWQTWEIDLARFAPNDPSRLHVALGFLIFPAEEPLAFSVRNARYE